MTSPVGFDRDPLGEAGMRGLQRSTSDNKAVPGPDALQSGEKRSPLFSHWVEFPDWSLFISAART